MSTKLYFNGGIIMGKNHGNNNKEVQETNKEVIEATVAPEETEAEDTAKETEDNNADVPPKKDNDDKKTEKKESLIKRAATKVKGGVSKVLNYKFSIGQVLAVTAGVATAVFVGKTLYEKGQRDAIEMGGDVDDDENLLEVHNDEVSYSEGGDDVYDVEETEAEEVEVPEDGDNEEVYDEEDEVYDEDMTE